jgi:hypothetical protein
MATAQTLSQQAAATIAPIKKRGQNGFQFETDVMRRMTNAFPHIVTKRNPYTEVWNKLPLRSDPPLLGGKLQIEQRREYDVVFADPYVFKRGLLIECKYQEVSGTAYNKIAYDVLRGDETARKFPGVTVAIVCGGNGLERGAGATVIQDCKRWRDVHMFKVEIFPTHRDFHEWWSHKMREYYT